MAALLLAAATALLLLVRRPRSSPAALIAAGPWLVPASLVLIGAGRLAVVMWTAAWLVLAAASAIGWRHGERPRPASVQQWSGAHPDEPALRSSELAATSSSRAQDVSMDPDVMEFDPGWAAAFRTERAALSAILGWMFVTDVEHVGSTSVPGMPAKPIIDMIVGVESLETAAGAHLMLAAHGYGIRKHRPEAHLFVHVDSDTGFDTHHLHLTVPGSDLWVERLAFRDALRGDPALADRYAAWKREHSTGDPDRAYDAVKTPFVAEVLATRGVGLKSDRRRVPP